MRRVEHLSDVVEVAMRDLLLTGRLLHLVEERVQVELGAEVLESTEAERLAAGDQHNRMQRAVHRPTESGSTRLTEVRPP